MRLPEDPRFSRMHDYISSRSRSYFAAETPFAAQQDEVHERLDLQRALQKLPANHVFVVEAILATDDLKQAESKLVQQLGCTKEVARQLVQDTLALLSLGS